MRRREKIKRKPNGCTLDWVSEAPKPKGYDPAFNEREGYKWYLAQDPVSKEYFKVKNPYCLNVWQDKEGREFVRIPEPEPFVGTMKIDESAEDVVEQIFGT